MPASNECINWAGVRSQISAGQLKWKTSDPGTGTLPSNKVNTAGEYNSYIANNGGNPYASNRAMDWSAMQAYRQLNVSNYAARFQFGASPNFSGQSAYRYGVPSDFYSFTAEAWVRIPANGRFSGDGVPMIANTRAVWTGDYDINGDPIYENSGWIIQALWSGSAWILRFYDVMRGAAIVTASSGFSANGWVHVAHSHSYTLSGVMDARLFLNGTQVGRTFSSAPMTSYHYYMTDSNMYGLNVWDSGQAAIMGYQLDIDEARYWNTNLADATIAANMTTQYASGTANLVGYWKLENNLLDSSGHGYTLGSSGMSYVGDTAF